MGIGSVTTPRWGITGPIFVVLDCESRLLVRRSFNNKRAMAVLEGERRGEPGVYMVVASGIPLVLSNWSRVEGGCCCLLAACIIFEFF